MKSDCSVLGRTGLLFSFLYSVSYMIHLLVKKCFLYDALFQIIKVLEFIGKKEGLQLPSGFAARIAEKSNRSLRRAILSLETCRVQQ